MSTVCHGRPESWTAGPERGRATPSGWTAVDCGRREAANHRRRRKDVVFQLEWFFYVFGASVFLVGVPLVAILYWEFGGEVIGSLIERPPWSRTVRTIQLVVLPIIILLAWKLTFREFSYGLTGLLAATGAIVWARTLWRGETWLWQREGRVNGEWAGPATLAGLSAAFLTSSVNPWF